MAQQLTPQAALIYTMVTAAAADRQIREEELSRINALVRELPVFRSFEGDWRACEAQDCGKILGRPEGVKRVVELVGEVLPAELYETAYVLAAEVVASDLAVKQAETDFLQMLSEELGLDHLICAALERAASARHRMA
jgi:uncharacterized membrane protein YebE (DUF533 family)